MLDVQNAVGRIRAALPPAVLEPRLYRISETTRPLLTLSLTPRPGGAKDLARIRLLGLLIYSPRRLIRKSGRQEGACFPQQFPDFPLSRFKKNGELRINQHSLLAENQIQDALLHLPGVADVDVFGAHRPEIKVDVARVTLGTSEPRSACHGDGQPAIAVNVMRLDKAMALNDTATRRSREKRMRIKRQRMLRAGWVAIAAFGLTLGAAGQVVLHDTFRPSLQRGWWWDVESPAKAWQQEKEIRFAHESMRFRFLSGRALLDSLEIVDAASGATVWQTRTFDKPLLTPVLPEADYRVRCRGRAGSERIVLAVNMYRNGFLLPTWDTAHAEVSHLAGGGIALAPQTPGQAVSLHARLFKLEPGRFYAVQLAFGCDRVTELLMRCTQRRDGARHPETTTLTSGVGDEQNWTVNVAALAGSMDLTLQIAGACRLHAITLREVPPPERRKQAGDKVFTFEPRNPEPEPPNPALRAPLAFRRPPRQIFESSIPQPFEVIDALDDFATPGEYAVWHFAVHNPREPRRLERLTVSDLKGGDGHIIPASALNLSHVRFWDYPRGPYTYYNIPELIEPQEAVDLAADANRLFWIQSRIPESTPAGVYTGTARVVCGDTPVALAVRLRVLPFTLMTPTNMVWAAYSRQHVRPQSQYPRNLAVRYLRDMADYGVTALHRTLGSEAEVRTFQSARREAGMRGPVIVYGIRAEHHAMERCGVTNDARWFDNPHVRQAFVDYLKRFDGWFRTYGGEGYGDWYYMGADEPHIRSMELSSWQNRLAREAGIQTAACVYAPRYVRELSPWLDLSCNSFISLSAAMRDELMQVAAGKPLRYWYLGGGAYTGQEGGLMPNRLDSGFMSFKLGVTGHLSYTYQAYASRARPDPYDNFMAGKSYGMTYPARQPTEQKVTVFSLEWEGIREGIVDYKYLYTLRELEQQARARGLAGAADAARGTREAILAHVPWREDRHYVADGLTQVQAFNNDIADKLRARAANAILALMEVLP